MGYSKPRYFLGIFEGGLDPAVALVENGKVIAFSEEERHIRFKHAPRMYPFRALHYCLDYANIKLSDVEAVAINLNLDAYTDGTLQDFFAQMRNQWPDIDDKSIQWQNALLKFYDRDSYVSRQHYHWRKAFGDIPFPAVCSYGHHYIHAFHAVRQSPFNSSVVLTIDGSGDQHCTTLWESKGDELELLREITMPNSLGWVYAAFTEYLGFDAYDGEYKVMGLAAFGKPDQELKAKVEKIVRPADDGIEYRVDPSFIHYGRHTYSERFTDKLVHLFDRPPRLSTEKLDAWHENIAYAVQEVLEESVTRLVQWAIKHTNNHRLCIGGGVALNVKMNTKLFELPEIHDVFAQPLCNDGGAAVGAALAVCVEKTGCKVKPLTNLALGHHESEAEIEKALRLANIDFETPQDICDATAKELARGRTVGWFQGRMEGGPRSLGQRSILADPRTIDSRDKVNGIIKFREYWRPFCPSMKAEAASRYFDRYTDAPYMIIAFRANEALKRDAPAIVHVDGTSRVQLVHKDVLPLYHRLLSKFEDHTGVPVLLNTSFNVKGEPIVCTIQDALRTFWATGLDILAAGGYLVRKPRYK